MKITYLRNIHYYIYILISVIVISILNLFLINLYKDNIELYRYYSNVKYEYIVNIDNYKSDSYYITSESYSLVLNEDDSLSGYINSNSLMLTNNKYSGLGYYNKSNILYGEYKILEGNECSITYNIALKYNINIGDTIYNLYKGNITEYKVINILKDTYNFSNPKAGSKDSYIFSAYNKDKVENARYLCFGMIDDEADKNASNYLIISNLLKSVKNKIITYTLIILVVYLMLVIVYYVLNKKDLLSMIRLYNLGYSKLKLILYLFIEMVITICIISLLGFISIINGNGLYLILESIILSLALYIINIFRLKRRLK